MKPVPTAEALINSKLITTRRLSAKHVADLMIEYARLHREAILEAAAEDVYVDFEGVVDKDSIRDCYPVELIK